MLSRVLSRGVSTLAESGTMAINGVNIFFMRSGSKGFPVVCLPGSMGTPAPQATHGSPHPSSCTAHTPLRTIVPPETAETDFGPQLKELSSDMQVVSFDPRGYGKSRPPRRAFAVDFYQQDADDAAALMKELGHDEYGVIGHSDGAISSVLLRTLAAWWDDVSNAVAQTLGEKLRTHRSAAQRAM